jgi:tripartite-type tricarboxylate transporter receptor subunit TctC
MMLRQFAAVMLAVLTIAIGNAGAQAFPDRPLRSIVPVSPGGGTDITARLIAERLGALWGQPILVENRTGAGGNLAAQLVARAKPDGYTIFAGHGGVLTINEFLFKDLGFDPHKDFDPVTLVATVPYIIAVHPDFPARTLKELIAILKAEPGKYFWASTAVGTPDHLGGELFQEVTGTKMTHVPFKGGADGLKEVISGRIPINYVTVVTSKAQVDAGRLRALAVTSTTRSPLLPNVPTVAEAGAPGAELFTWFAMWVPGGTPLPVREKMASDVKKLFEDQEFKEKFLSYGFTPQPMTPAEFDAFVKKERAKFGTLIGKLGLQKE